MSKITANAMKFDIIKRNFGFINIIGCCCWIIGIIGCNICIWNGIGYILGKYDTIGFNTSKFAIFESDN